MTAGKNVSRGTLECNGYALQDPTTPARYKLKQPVYALQVPEAPGLYIRLDGERPRLTRLQQACLAPAHDKGLAWLAERVNGRLQSTPHELVRLDA